MSTFAGKVGVVQRVLAEYRAPFFNALGQACPGGLEVFAGEPRDDEMIKTATSLDSAHLIHGKNLHLLKSNFYLCLQFGLLRWLKQFNPDILIVEANPRYLRTPAALRWMRKRARPVIGWGLGAPPISGLLTGLRRRRRTHFISQFDALITYSQTGAAEYVDSGFPKDRVFIAINAMTPAPEHPLPQRTKDLSAENLRLLFVGRLQARKNLDNLITTCSRLPASLQPDLLIVGDGPERTALEALAAKVYPKAHLTGALYGDDLEEQFQKADLFVLPGTGGLALQQAMSYGLPVIAAQADGTQADLVRPENGWQIPSDDIDALVQTLSEALSDLPNLRRMGEESYRIVKEEINLEKMVSVFLDALQRTS